MLVLLFLVTFSEKSLQFVFFRLQWCVQNDGGAFVEL